ncbi:MAG TPA: phosphate/phosphite/phosphonate ABC transporter substrate-binding protein [Thermomicrobiales bacterium]|nr:phosphate/phosphite/phosphonate ABC transporter substrate-binding protein [Thermomicrobiales bacterium]
MEDSGRPQDPEHHGQHGNGVSREAEGGGAPSGSIRPFIFAFASTVAGRTVDHDNRTQPLRNYLERVLERPVRLVAPESYAETLADLQAGRADAAMLGEYATRQGQMIGGVEPLVAPVGADEEVPTYRSAIVTRIDSGIRDLDGLRGKSFGLVDEQSTSGYLVPRAMLREVDIDPDTDVEIRLFGQHRNVIEAVIAGEVVAGAAHEIRLKPPSLDRGPDYARLRVIARSRPIPLGPLVIRSSLDAKTREILAAAMLRVHEVDPVAAEVLIRSGHRFTIASRPASPTLKSIAALAGVSYATVSRVVNESGYVAPATAARVKAVIAEVGYVPNGNARVLQGQQAPLVGLVIPFGESGEAEDLGARLAAVGVPMVLCPVRGRLAASPFLQVVRDRRLGALIVGPQHIDDPDLMELARTGHAIVAIGVDEDAVAPGVVVTTLDRAAESVLISLGWKGHPALASATR